MADFTSRIYLFDPDEQLRRLSVRVYEGLIWGDDSLPELANTTVRAAFVRVVTEGKNLVEIDRINGERWSLDNFGRLDEETRKAQREHMKNVVNRRFERERPSAEDDVIDLSAKFAEQLVSRFSWKPTDRDVTRIIHDLWPEAAGKKIKSAKYLKGGRRKVAPLTHNAERRWHSMQEALRDITIHFHFFGLKDLRGLADHILDDFGDPHDAQGNKIRAGILDAIEYEAARQNAWMRKGGVWYAVLYVTERIGDDSWRGDIPKEIKCDGRDEAIKVCRKLLKDNAHRFSDTRRVEVELHPEIEWTP